MTTATSTFSSTSWRRSRGLATCGLWMSAIEKMKKNQWNELEINVRLVAKLQPHFVTPWLFRLPWFSRFDGYTMWDLVLLRGPLGGASDDLVVHELCHVWQMQHLPLRMPLSYLRGYADNPYELEARNAVERSR